MGSSLHIRKRKDGTTTIEGGLPEKHTFSARWIQRELGTLCKVTLTVMSTAGHEEYELTGFEPILDSEGNQAVTDDGSPKWNFTGLECVRKAAKKPKKEG